MHLAVDPSPWPRSVLLDPRVAVSGKTARWLTGGGTLDRHTQIEREHDWSRDGQSRTGVDVATMTYRDVTPTGKEVDRWTLPNVPERITVREMVRLRVREEVARHNATLGPVFQGLVQPTGTELGLNGYRMPDRRQLDWEKQADVAEEAFGRNGFFILVRDKQVENLDEVIDLSTNVDGSDVDIAFIKLVQLVGG